MRGDLPSISSAVLCSPLGLAALHSQCQQHQGHHAHARAHTHTKTHTYTFIAGSSSVVCTNKHINSFVFPLCLSVSRRLKPVWFYLYCFSLGPKLYLFYSKACTHLGPESAYSSIHWFTAMHMVLPQRDSAIL